MSAVIAERELSYFAGDQIEPGFIRVFAPEDRKGDWRCGYQIQWPGFEKELQVCGVDSFQALALALRIVAVEISATADFKSGRIGMWNQRISNLAELSEQLNLGPLKGFEQ